MPMISHCLEMCTTAARYGSNIGVAMINPNFTWSCLVLPYLYQALLCSVLVLSDIVRLEKPSKSYQSSTSTKKLLSLIKTIGHIHCYKFETISKLCQRKTDTLKAFLAFSFFHVLFSILPYKIY